MSAPGKHVGGSALLLLAHPFDIEAVTPEPDRQQPHEDDEAYTVLEGSGTLDVEGERFDLREGHATFVPAGAEHRFVGDEQLSVLVIFERRQR